LSLETRSHCHPHLIWQNRKREGSMMREEWPCSLFHVYQTREGSLLQEMTLEMDSHSHICGLKLKVSLISIFDFISDNAYQFCLWPKANPGSHVSPRIVFCSKNH